MLPRLKVRHPAVPGESTPALPGAGGLEVRAGAEPRGPAAGTSRCTQPVESLSAVIRPATVRARVSWLSTGIIRAPSRATKRAVVSPMPEAVPVTGATLPCSRPMSDGLAWMCRAGSHATRAGE